MLTLRAEFLGIIFGVARVARVAAGDVTGRQGAGETLERQAKRRYARCNRGVHGSGQSLGDAVLARADEGTLDVTPNYELPRLKQEEAAARQARAAMPKGRNFK